MLFWILVSVLAIFAVSAGCGGGDDDDGGSGGGDDQPTATSADGGQDSETATATEGSSDDDSDDGGDDGNDGSGDGGNGTDSDTGLAKIKAAAATLGQQTFHVVFEVQSASIDGAFTLTSEPPNSLVGMKGTIDGTAGSYLIITLDDFLYFCSDSDGQQACIKTKAGQSIPIQLPTLIDAGDIANQIANAPDMSIEQVDGETIAGISAECYEFTSPNETGKVCIGDDMLLSYDGTYEGNAVSMRAAEFTDEAGAIEISAPDWPTTDLTSLGN
jgi:hypothetical protein